MMCSATIGFSHAEDLSRGLVPPCHCSRVVSIELGRSYRDVLTDVKFSYLPAFVSHKLDVSQ